MFRLLAVPLTITTKRVIFINLSDGLKSSYLLADTVLDQRFDEPYSKEKLLDILNDARSNETPLIVFIDYAAIIVHARPATERPPKYQVLEQHRVILVQTDDKEKAFKVFENSHRKYNWRYHEIQEYFDDDWAKETQHVGWNGIAQYKPGDMVN